MNKDEILQIKQEIINEITVQHQVIHGRMWDYLIALTIAFVVFMIYHIVTGQQRRKRTEALYNLVLEIHTTQAKEIQYREEQAKIHEIEKEHWVTDRRNITDQLAFLQKQQAQTFEKKS